MRWEYYIDYIIHLNFLGAGVVIPQDLGLVHTLRGRFFDFHSSELIVISILEFAGRFGAKTLEAEKHLSDITEMEREAEKLYIRQEYEEALSWLGDVEEELEPLLVDALKLKDKALVWIYLIEWLTVTGTGMICGTILWAIMMKRKLYKAVTATRLASE